MALWVDCGLLKVARSLSDSMQHSQYLFNVIMRISGVPSKTSKTALRIAYTLEPENLWTASAYLCLWKAGIGATRNPGVLFSGA